MDTFSNLLDHFAIEGGQIIGLATGDETKCPRAFRAWKIDYRWLASGGFQGAKASDNPFLGKQDCGSTSAVGVCCNLQVDRKYYIYLTLEDYIVEWATFGFLLVSGILALVLAARSYKMRKRSVLFFGIFELSASSLP
jgi:hypothetical protein